MDIKKTIYKIFGLTFLVLFLTQTTFVFAEDSQNQSSTIQKAFENVKDQIDALISNKDESKLTELSTRIITFKKVLDFSLIEVKDLKVKLLTFDFENEEELAIWQKEMIEKLNQSAKFYEEEKQNLEDRESVIGIEQIKLIAQDLKNYRETNYLPISEEINSFLLIEKEKQAIQTAKKRYQKISEDVQRLQKKKVKGASELSRLLKQSNDLIEKGDLLNRNAEELFEKSYLQKNETSEVVSSGTEAEAVVSNEKSKEILKIIPDLTEELATSTESGEVQFVSIKDLVKDSLDKVRGAYQVFIEMSNLVRKLL